MTTLNDLHKTAVETAKTVRSLQAQAETEMTEENNFLASKTTRIALKEAHKAYHKAMNAFQNEIDEIGVQNVPNLKELYAQIGTVTL